MSVLRSDFSGAFDTALFTKYENSGTVTQTGGEIIFDGMVINIVEDVTAVNAAGDNFTVQISSYPAANGDYRFMLGIIDDAGRAVGMKISSGDGRTLLKQNSGTSVSLEGAVEGNYGTWSVANAFMRITVHATNNTADFQHSTDGATWVDNIMAIGLPTGFNKAAVRGTFGIAGAYNTCIYKVTNYWAPPLGATSPFRAAFLFNN